VRQEEQEAVTAKRKRPKVRYVVDELLVPKGDLPRWFVERDFGGYGHAVCRAYGERAARRIAAALNLYEAVKKGEM